MSRSKESWLKVIFRPLRKQSVDSSLQVSSAVKRFLISEIGFDDDKCQTLFATSRVKAGCRVSSCDADATFLVVEPRLLYALDPFFANSATPISRVTFLSFPPTLQQRTARVDRICQSGSADRSSGS